MVMIGGSRCGGGPEGLRAASLSLGCVAGEGGAADSSADWFLAIGETVANVGSDGVLTVGLIAARAAAAATWE